jgi:hypothetical protein
MTNFILIALGILLLVFFLRLGLKVLKTVISIAVLLVVGTVALHFFAPETLDKIIGAENHAAMVARVEGEVDKKMDELTDAAVDKAKKEIVEKLAE